jgi:hypothetical protein
MISESSSGDLGEANTEVVRTTEGPVRSTVRLVRVLGGMEEVSAI